MRKADVIRSYHNGMRGLPMVNVKCYDTDPTEADWWRSIVDHGARTDPATLADYYESTGVDGIYWDIARETCWDWLAEEAAEVWPGAGVQVWSAGRSGGWAVVEGLRPVDEWDAIAVARWARWSTFAALVATEGLRDQIAWLVVDAWTDDQAREHAELAEGVPYWIAS
jgi:hypothetical protein